MAKKYSERIENMDSKDREELDARIREYAAKNNWQKTLAKFKPSPIQLRAILAGKDASKAKARKKTKAELEAAVEKKAKKAAKKAGKKTTKKSSKKKAKKAAKKATKKKAKKATKKRAKAQAAPKKRGRPKGSRNKKKAKKKTPRNNGVVTKSAGDIVVEGRIAATDFVSMILSHSERLVKAARA
jgi:sulfite reductase alpha subunit-like flavoprotein